MEELARLQLLSLAGQDWERGISPGISQKALLTRKESNSHAQLYLVKMETGVKSPAHRHPHPQIFYVLSGLGQVQLDQHTFDLVPGSVVRILNGELHGFENKGKEDLIMIEMQIFDIKIDLRKAFGLDIGSAS